MICNQNRKGRAIICSRVCDFYELICGQGVLGIRGRDDARCLSFKCYLEGRRRGIGDGCRILLCMPGPLEVPDASVQNPDGLKIKIGPIQDDPFGCYCRKIRGIDDNIFQFEVQGVVKEDCGWL